MFIVYLFWLVSVQKYKLKIWWKYDSRFSTLYRESLPENFRIWVHVAISGSPPNDTQFINAVQGEQLRQAKVKQKKRKTLESSAPADNGTKKKKRSRAKRKNGKR